MQRHGTIDRPVKEDLVNYRWDTRALELKSLLLTRNGETSPIVAGD